MNPQRSRIPIGTPLAAAVLLVAPIALAAEPVGHQPSKKKVGPGVPLEAIELERQDDPPSLYEARADALARSPSPRIKFGSYQSIQVNVDAAGHNIVGDAANEPSIAVNPANPLNMVVAWRQFDSVTSNFRQAGWAYTFNGGQTWTFPGKLTPGIFRSDPVLDVDASGIFYYQSLKSDFTADVFRSTDGGVSWLSPVAEFGGDKNWLVVDRRGGPTSATGESSQAPVPGMIYGIWQRFASCCDLAVLTRSVDGGASFETPVPVTTWPTFGGMAVGPNAELYATGIDGTVTQDFDHFVVAKSINAAIPAETPTFTGGRVELGGGMRIGAGPNPAGLLGQGNVAVDLSSGPTRGNVYIAATVAGDPNNANIIRSTDGGVTWSTPIRVSDDPKKSNWQWMETHSVAPSGRIDMIWDDSRNGGQPNLSQLFYAYSWDGGATWSPGVAVSPIFDSFVGFPNQNKIGDYSTIVSNETGADVAYAATFNNEQDVFYVRVFPDCNANGVSDVTDIASAASADCDSNQVPDECQPGIICGPSVAYASSAHADSCLAGGAGNGNGSVDPGEDVLLPITLRNDGTVSLTGISAVLTTSTPGVTVTRATSTYPNMAAHATASGNSAFAFTAGTGVACGGTADFSIAVTAAQGSWSRTFSVRIGTQATTTTTFGSTDVPKPIPEIGTVSSSLTVPATATLLDLDVGVSLTHTYDGDLVLVVIAPDGTRSLLASAVGDGGQNFTDTVFDDEGATPIEEGTAPFTGHFRPQQPLSGLDGIPANGTWQLEIQDVNSGDSGTLTDWSLTPTLANGFACSSCNISAPAQEPVTVAWTASKNGLSWESIPGATFYNVYRGAGAALPNLLSVAADSCRRMTTTTVATGGVLAETPPADAFYWYLVRAANGAGEGPAGNATAGPRIQNSSGDCP